MAGLTVTRDNFDSKISDAMLSFRRAIRECQKIDAFLSNNPATADPADDLLKKPRAEGGFEYTDDEAYLVRFLFQKIRELDTEPILNDGRKLTGLE
jgi:hypothetical protein